MSDSSTVDSSEAADKIQQQYKNMRRTIATKSQLLAESVPSIKVDDNEGIQVRNVIYNIFHHSPRIGMKKNSKN